MELQMVLLHTIYVNQKLFLFLIIQEPDMAGTYTNYTFYIIKKGKLLWNQSQTLIMIVKGKLITMITNIPSNIEFADLLWHIDSLNLPSSYSQKFE